MIGKVNECTGLLARRKREHGRADLFAQALDHHRSFAGRSLAHVGDMTYRAVPPRSGPWWFSGWVALWSTSVDPESLAFRRRSLNYARCADQRRRGVIGGCDRTPDVADHLAVEAVQSCGGRREPALQRVAERVLKKLA